MDDGADEELQRLRARAYGPDADIDGDPEAMARLAELEQLRQQDPPATPPDASEAVLRHPDRGDVVAGAEGRTDAADAPPSAAIPGDGEAPGEQPDGGGDEPEGAASADPRAVRRQRWKRRAGWGASIAATALITAAATTAVTFPLTPLSPVPRDVDVQQVATLLVDEDFVVPSAFGEDLGDAYGFEPFAGLRAITVERGWANPGTDGCLIVVSDRLGRGGQEFIEGPLYFGCSAGPFPSAVNLRVTPDSPRGLRDAYPEGTSLQFLHDGSRIAVFVTG
ncbi:hypothetical protein [Microbacterium sp. SLBN-146]|uniref:hypothetical protein n=1 Tax=Microbacterium sp. SLBN-146 TaxID=2768457 RepID=UPI0011541515|nr:hypothetical protein [Microbacterium sp. SLBN-146]